MPEGTASFAGISEMTVEPPPARDLRTAASRTAVIAGVFAVIVAGLMLTTHLRSLQYNPSFSPEIAALKQQYFQTADSAQQAALAQQIRDLDLQLRAITLQSRDLLRRGAWLLAIGIAVLCISLRYALSAGPRLPAKQTGGAAAELPAAARRSVAFTALAMLLGALVVAVTNPSPSYIGDKIDKTAAIAASQQAQTAAAFPPYPDAAKLSRNWPRFRGLSGLGIVSHPDIPQQWDAATGAGVLWKTEIPLPGKNSPIVWENRVFLTGADKDRRQVYCYDADSGELVWQRELASSVATPEVWDDTGYAAPTAATDGRQVYALFATGDIAAFNFDGTPRWARALGPLDNAYGHASSLELWKNFVFVQLDQGHSSDAGLSVLYALDAQTGRTAWQVQRPVQGSWASPAVFATASGAQLLTLAAPYVMAYDPATGAELWRARCMSGDVAPSAVYADGTVYVSQEYARAAAIATDGRGDVSETHIRWSAYDGLPDTVSPLTDGQQLYLINSYGLVTCLDAASGAAIWEHYFDAEFKASPVLAGNLVYLPDTAGTMHIFENAREFNLVATAQLAEPMFATPAFVAGRIYVRGKQHLYCIGTAHPDPRNTLNTPGENKESGGRNREPCPCLRTDK